MVLKKCKIITCIIWISSKIFNCTCPYAQGYTLVINNEEEKIISKLHNVTL